MLTLMWSLQSTHQPSGYTGQSHVRAVRPVPASPSLSDAFLPAGQLAKAQCPPRSNRKGPAEQIKQATVQGNGSGAHARASREPSTRPTPDHTPVYAPSQPPAPKPASPYASHLYPHSCSTHSKHRWQDPYHVDSWSAATSTADRTPPRRAANAVLRRQAPAQGEGGTGHVPLQSVARWAIGSTTATAAAEGMLEHHPEQRARICTDWPSAVQPRSKHARPGGRGPSSSQDRHVAEVWAAPRMQGAAVPPAPSSGSNRRAAWLQAAARQDGERGADLQPLQFNTEGTYALLAVSRRHLSALLQQSLCCFTLARCVQVRSSHWGNPTMHWWRGCALIHRTSHVVPAICTAGPRVLPERRALLAVSVVCRMRWGRVGCAADTGARVCRRGGGG